ncbi:MAG TPA: DUF417 family protein, partial [Bacteriovoracaceae bacterium]|nr:DUF417 family protein [Bacteriovoracaceae bacterium]
MIKNLLEFFSRLESAGYTCIRVSIFIIMAWIGGLKYFAYEADGIVPFVANSPLMSFFYAKEAPEYKQYMNPEGVLNEKNRQWHKENRTYLFSYGLGAVIILIGILVLAGIVNPQIGAVGDLLTIIMSVVTLSFLITTPENWVPALGDSDY